MTKEKTLVLVYPGLGKTYTAEHFENVIDFEQQFYTYIYDDSIKHLPLDQIKLSMATKKPNPDFPQNYIKDISKELREDRITITTLIQKTYEALIGWGYFPDVRIILVTFDPDNFEELANRYRARGDSEEFIERRRVDFPKTVELVNNAPSNVEKIVVKSGEYLSDALISYGIELRPGKGEKNYL